MVSFIKRLFKDIFKRRKRRVPSARKVEALELEILRLRHVIHNLEKNYAEISGIVKNQSGLISAIAGIQSDMIGTFVMNTFDSHDEDKLKSQNLKSVIIFPSEDDDMIN